MDLPIYKISLNPTLSQDGEELGYTRIAHTADPAILTKGLAFNEKKMRFQDESKMRIVAPIMIPMHIYRFDEDGEYFCQFDRPTIEALFVKHQDMKDRGLIGESFNVDHNNNELAPTFPLETWMVGNDPKADRAYSEFGLDVPAGTVMMIAQSRDKKFYDEEIVAKGKTGFSIEGFLGLELTKQLKTKLNKNMKELNFEAIKLADGTDIYVDGALAVDSYIYSDKPTYMLINGVKSEVKYPIWGSVFETADGNILTVADSKIVEITKKEAVVTEVVAETKLNTNMKKKFNAAYLADGTPIWIDETTKEVYTVDENMDKVPLFDGEHKLADGSIIVTVAGKVTETKDKAEEGEEAPVVAVEAAVEPVVEEVVEEAPVAEVAIEGGEEEKILKIVQPKLDELIQKIAGLEAKLEEMAAGTGSVQTGMQAPVASVKHSRLSALEAIDVLSK